MVTGGRAMVDCLRREGVQHVFGIPGTQNLGVIDALRDAPDVKFVLTRHEQGAAFMAYGFARASGRPGVVTATEGPGVTNLATGVAAAFKGFVPMITITGTQEAAIRERDTSQQIDQVSFLGPITKWAYEIPTANKVAGSDAQGLSSRAGRPLRASSRRGLARRVGGRDRERTMGAGIVSSHRAARL